MPYKTVAGKERWVNDAPRKRFTLPNAILALRNYACAREFGHSPEGAARYAIYAHERRVWHNGQGYRLRLNKGEWMTSTRLEATVERLCGLIGGTFRRTVTTQNLEGCLNGNLDSVIWQWICEKKENKLCSKGEKKVWKAMENYGRIVGEVRYKYATDLQTYVTFSNPINCYKDNWARVSRGRELFYLGRFNISAAVEKAFNENRGSGQWPNGDCSTRTDFNVLSTSDIVASAFDFDSSVEYALLCDWFYMEKKFEENPDLLIEKPNNNNWLLYAHVRLYRHVWMQPAWRGRLDELERLKYDIPWFEGDDRVDSEGRCANDYVEMHPAVLLRTLQRHRDSGRDRFVCHYETPEQAARREFFLKMREVVDAAGPEFALKTYDYPDLEVDGYSMEVVRTKGGLKQVVTALHNCAFNYLIEAAVGECVMIAARKDEKITALGKITVNESGIPLREHWDQVEQAASHRTPSPEVREAYRRYLLTATELVKASAGRDPREVLEAAYGAS